MNQFIIRACNPYPHEPGLTQEQIEYVLRELEAFLEDFDATSQYNKEQARFEISVPREYLAAFMEAYFEPDDDGVTYCPECQP